MHKLRRYGTWTLALGGGYVLLLIGLGWGFQGCAGDLIGDRIATALDADVDVGDVSLSLTRGQIAADDIKVVRTHQGHLELTIEHIDVDTAPLGWVVWDRAPRFVDVRGVSMTLSSGLKLPKRPKRQPLHIGGMRLRDIDITFMPASFMPKLGQIKLQVEEARTGAFVMSSALDWVFALEQLRASADLPAGITAGVHFQDGTLTLDASLFGSKPLVVPFSLPVPEPDALESEKARLLLNTLAKTLGTKAAKHIVTQQIKDRLRGLFD